VVNCPSAFNPSSRVAYKVLETGFTPGLQVSGRFLGFSCFPARFAPPTRTQRSKGLDSFARNDVENIIIPSQETWALSGLVPQLFPTRAVPVATRASEAEEKKKREKRKKEMLITRFPMSRSMIASHSRLEARNARLLIHFSSTLPVI
jgi:hypothetical protein